MKGQGAMGFGEIQPVLHRAPTRGTGWRPRTLHTLHFPRRGPARARRYAMRAQPNGLAPVSDRAHACRCPLVP